MAADISLDDKFVRIKGSGSGFVEIDGDKKQIKAGLISIDGDNGKINVHFPSPFIDIKNKSVGVKLVALPAQKPPGPGKTKPLDLTRDLVEEILNLRKYVKDLYVIAGEDVPPELNE